MSAVSTPLATTAPTTAPTSSPASPADGMEHGVYYAHYLRDSATKPAPTYYRALLEGAKRKVIIWDPYFNQNAFESIDNEAAAYYLGLLITDGCVLEPNIEITFLFIYIKYITF